MDRREFIKALGLIGAAVALPLAIPEKRAASTVDLLVSAPDAYEICPRHHYNCRCSWAAKFYMPTRKAEAMIGRLGFNE